jgi:hypothetical protein
LHFYTELDLAGKYMVNLAYLERFAYKVLPLRSCPVSLVAVTN